MKRYTRLLILAVAAIGLPFAWRAYWSEHQLLKADLGGLDVLVIGRRVEFSGTGTVNGGLTVNAGGSVAQTSGTLTVNGAITNSGTIRFTGGAALNANGATSFVNNGVVDIINGSAQFPANFSNGANGLVLTPGSVQVKNAAKNGNTVSIHIDSYSGHTFRLQRTGSLAQAFTDVGTVQNGATGSTLTFTDNNAPVGQGFYRVAVD